MCASVLPSLVLHIDDMWFEQQEIGEMLAHLARSKPFAADSILKMVFLRRGQRAASWSSNYTTIDMLRLIDLADSTSISVISPLRDIKPSHAFAAWPQRDTSCESADQ